MDTVETENHWLGVVIGNSRLHWGWFRNEALLEAWDTPHLSNPVKVLPEEILLARLREREELPLYVASVVPSQTTLFQYYSRVNLISLDSIPLKGIYATMGIDRALALWGAIQFYDAPILVIDAGTALTFTGAGEMQELVGGAILPGLKIQFQSLHSQTAALPEGRLPHVLPKRWERNTVLAIESGIIYTTLAGIEGFIKTWWRDFPSSQVVLTGGDGERLLSYFEGYNSNIARELIVDRNLIFWGMENVVRRWTRRNADKKVQMGE